MSAVSECPHDLPYADGLCPLCLRTSLAAALERAEKAEKAFLVGDPHLSEMIGREATWYDAYVGVANARNSYMDEVTRLQARETQLVEALPDADKLDMLALWFDQDDIAKGRAGHSEVQKDLRRWASAIRAALLRSRGEGGE